MGGTMQMLGLRPYKKEDADTILSWSKDEKAFYQWSAGIMGKYPITRDEFGFVESLMAFTAFDENGNVGFFTLRNPDGKTDELRIGFVIVDPERRGCGTGKEMLLLGLRYAFDIYGAKKVSLGVFENNDPAYDALAIIANHFLFPDFSTRELYFFFCIALVIGVDSTPAAIPIIQTYFQFVSSPKRTISAAETSQYRI